MRIACVNQDPGIRPGHAKGAAVHLAAMRDAFSELGAEVLAFDEPEESYLRLRLEKAHSQAPFDLIYERYALGKSAASEVAQAWSVPFVLEVNAPLALERERYRGQLESAEDRARDGLLFQRADRVIAVSAQVAAYARERGARSDRVRIFANSADTARFRPRQPGDSLRRSLVPAGRFALGFHGRLRPWHGFEALVEVTARLLALGVPVQLVLVGEGDFDAVVGDRLPAERISRVGWVPHEEIPGYVASFDALPLTYSPEAPCYFSPLKLAEAMACGVVPVVPDLGDLPSLVHHDLDGLVYPAGNLDRLTADLARLADDELLHRRLAKRARRRIARTSWKRIAAWALGSARPHAGVTRKRVVA